MNNNALQWGNATLTWAPQISPETMILRIPAFIERYAAIELEEPLSKALAELSNVDGQHLMVEVQPGEKYSDDRGTTFDEGQVVITADHLTDRLDPSELRAITDRLTAHSIEIGDTKAKKDLAKARAFLDGLASAE